MAQLVEQIIVEVSMDSRDFQRDLQKTTVSIQRFGRDATMAAQRGEKGMNSFLTRSRVALLALAVAAKKASSAVLKAGDAYDLLNQKLIATTGSTEEANKAFQFSIQLANKLGLELQATTDGFSKFLQAGGAAFGDDTSKIFEQLSTGIAGLGANTEQTRGIFLAFSQILAKGKVSMEEINQLAERGIGRNLIAEALGVENLDNVGTDAGVAIEKIASFLETRFGAAAKKGANSIRAMQNRVSNRLFLLQKDINNLIKPFRAFFLNLGNLLVDKIREFMPEIKSFINFLKEGIAFITRTLVPIVVAVNEVKSAFISAIFDIIKAFGSLIATFIPFKSELDKAFSTESADTFVEFMVRGIFRVKSVIESFSLSVQKEFLDIKKSIIDTFGLSAPKTLLDQIERVNKKLNENFEKNDKEATDLLKKFRSLSDSIKDFREGIVKGNLEASVRDIDSAVATQFTGAVEFGSSEAFKIISTKAQSTASQNLKANQQTARTVTKIARDGNKPDKVLDVR